MGCNSCPYLIAFNPEGEIGVSLSNFQGGRRLNTKRTRKFALRSQSGIIIFLFRNLFLLYYFAFWITGVIGVRCMFNQGLTHSRITWLSRNICWDLVTNTCKKDIKRYMPEVCSRHTKKSIRDTYPGLVADIQERDIKNTYPWSVSDT